jgi:hypothetical protein
MFDAKAFLFTLAFLAALCYVAWVAVIAPTMAAVGFAF